MSVSTKLFLCCSPHTYDSPALQKQQVGLHRMVGDDVDNSSRVRFVIDNEHAATISTCTTSLKQLSQQGMEIREAEVAKTI